MNAPKLWLAAFLMVSLCSPGWGSGLHKALEAALQIDPTYQAARAELASSLQNLPIARAALRPTLSLSISDSKVDGSRTIDNPPLAPLTQPLDYRAPAQSLNLRAPLFNREAAKKIELAQAQEQYALALLRVRQSELVDRLAKAWLDERLADHMLAAMRTQVQAAQMQSDIAIRRLALGEGTRPEVADAASALESARVQVAEAQSLRDLATLTLSQMTGQEQRQAAAPIQTPTSLPLFAPSLGQLLAQAESNNTSLAVRRFALQAAQAAVERARSGHYPRLDLVASLTQSSNESLSTVNQSATQQSFGLQLNVPLYSGGAVAAGVTQALADLNRSEAELGAEQQLVVREVTRLYFIVSNGVSKTAALQTAIDAGRLNLEAAQKGLNSGFATQMEIAQARRKLAQARQEWAQGIHERLLATLRLQLRAGEDSATAIQRLDSALTTSTFAAPANGAWP